MSTKGVTGHALGAAGALEAAAVVLSIQHRLIPPTANTKVIEDEMQIDVVMGEAAAVGARSDAVEQLRLRRSQRLDHHRAGLRPLTR